MDRALFDKTRREVQDELRALGETVVIPDPEDGEYLSTFMAIQRKHPRLAARLVEAEQADPADLLPPPPDRPFRPTWRHRVNHITQRLWMRRGLDGNLVWDRNRVLRSGLITAGALMGGVLIYSVAAPRPTVTASAASATPDTAEASGSAGDSSTGADTDTSGAFPAGAPDPNRASDPGTQAQLDEIAAEEETGAVTPDETPIDESPRPVTAGTSGATPPPPAVFREMELPEETVPVYAPVPDPTPTPAPVPDAPPTPVTASAAPSFGEEQPAPFAQEEPAPPTVQPFALVDPGTPEPTPAPTKPKAVKVETVSPPPFTPANSDTLFGGGDTPPTPFPSALPLADAPEPTRPPAPVTLPQVEVEPPPTRGQALMYQRPPEAKPQEQAQAPRSALVYQAAAREQDPSSNPGSTNTPRTAMVYQTAAKEGRASPADTTSRSALVYQASAQGGTAASAGRDDPALQGNEEQAGLASGPGARGGAIMYQRSAAPATASATAAAGPAEFGTTAAAPPADPDAPKFSPTSQIPAKTLTAVRTAAGVDVPIVVVSNEGNWIGTATYNPALARVDMTFGSFVHMKSGKTYPVQALGYQAVGGNLSQGVAAKVRPIAPTLGLDLARAGLNSLNVYTQALAGAGTTSTNGTVTTATRQAPAFAQVLRGELGKLAQLPEDNQTITVVADVATGTDVIILFGVGNTAGTQ